MFEKLSASLATKFGGVSIILEREWEKHSEQMEEVQAEKLEYKRKKIQLQEDYGKKVRELESSENKKVQKRVNELMHYVHTNRTPEEAEKEFAKFNLRSDVQILNQIVVGVIKSVCKSPAHWKVGEGSLTGTMLDNQKYIFRLRRRGSYANDKDWYCYSPLQRFMTKTENLLIEMVLGYLVEHDTIIVRTKTKEVK